MTLVEMFQQYYPREDRFKVTERDYGTLMKYEVEDMLDEFQERIEAEKQEAIRAEVIKVLDDVLSFAIGEGSIQQRAITLRKKYDLTK